MFIRANNGLRFPPIQKNLYGYHLVYQAGRKEPGHDFNFFTRRDQNMYHTDKM